MAGIKANSKPKGPVFPHVAIVIVQYGGWRHTVACLESLARLDYPAFEMLVIDNGSLDSSATHLEDWAKNQQVCCVSQTTGSPLTDSKLTILCLPDNLGYAGGNNAAFRLILDKNSAKYVWLLNNDTTVDPNALNHLVDRLEHDSSIGFVGSTVVHAEHRQTIQAMAGGYFIHWLAHSKLLGEGQKWNKEQILSENIENRLDFILGASCLARMDLLKRVGLMDESLFLYFEELDWAIRAREYYRLAYAPESIIYHQEGASISAGNITKKGKSPIADYYFHRNRLVIVRRYYPLFLVSAYASLLVTLLRRIIRQQWNRLPLILKAGWDALWIRKNNLV